MTVKIDQETLKTQDNLTEDQAEAIAAQALAEMDADSKKNDNPDNEDPAKDQGKPADDGTPKEETALSDEELLSANDEGLSDEQKTKKAELVEVKRKEDEKRILEAKEEDLSEEDKTKKVEIVKAQEENKSKEAEKEIADYAKEHNISTEEARQDLESIVKIQEKYKGDPKQLAKANLHLQRLYSKTEEEAKALKEAKPAIPQDITVEAVEAAIVKGVLNVDGKAITKEMTIEAYRNAYPDLTDDLDDEKVFKLAAKEYKQQIDKVRSEEKSQIAVKAKEKRETIFAAIPEADKKFIPDIKPIIEKLSDAQVMHDSFTVDTYVTYAKGMSFDETVKKLEDDKKAFGEKEYKRGLEEAKILGVKRTPGGNAPKGSGDVTLTDSQRQRAREMFDNPDITEEKAYQLYKDYLKETKQT
jgi:hypothetical protein